MNGNAMNGNAMSGHPMSDSVLQRSSNSINALPKTLRIALFGFGVVGTGVWQILQAKRSEFRERFGVEIEIAGICIRDGSKSREAFGADALLTTDLNALLADDAVDVVLELIGGRFAAQSMIEDALRARKHVITANKLVLAHELPRLRALANRNGVNLLYSASVCGSVPVLRALDELKIGDTITAVRGIVNGSTNFILTMMSENGANYNEACLEARRLGFLEADPTLDVSGADAAQKLSVLTYHAFGEHVTLDKIATTGIEGVATADFAAARSRGNTIKLLAEARRTSGGAIDGSISPQEIPLTHLFAHTRDEFNALEISTAHAGPQVLYGKGAGSLPTASAVISDLIELLKEGYY
jgi:homoserine dehydrogenase